MFVVEIKQNNPPFSLPSSPRKMLKRQCQARLTGVKNAKTKLFCHQNASILHIYSEIAQPPKQVLHFSI